MVWDMRRAQAIAMSAGLAVGAVTDAAIAITAAAVLLGAAIIADVWAVQKRRQ